MFSPFLVSSEQLSQGIKRTTCHLAYDKHFRQTRCFLRFIAILQPIKLSSHNGAVILVKLPSLCTAYFMKICPSSAWSIIKCISSPSSKTLRKLASSKANYTWTIISLKKRNCFSHCNLLLKLTVSAILMTFIFGPWHGDSEMPRCCLCSCKNRM